MPTVLGLSGSLRKASYNSALLRAAQELAPPGLSIEIGSIAEVPLYDADLREEPPAVKALKDKAAACDAILLATPEYNYGVPGGLKNAIDWMSRPPADIDRVFYEKVAGIIGASTGGGGTRFAQAAWLPTLHGLGLRIFNGDWYVVAGAAKKFDADGRLVDEDSRKYLADYLAGFAAFIAGQRRA